MAGTDAAMNRRLEGRSLTIAMYGNLFMAAAGVLAGLLSNSNAIMMDGLFSFIGFVSALLGRRISRKVTAGPDRFRPLGYAADESIFVTFRSLSLLGLVIFAITAAAQNIYRYMTGVMPEPLNFGPMVLYFVVVGATCVVLWWSHRRAWIRSGRSSDILRLESRASAFDGVITGASGIGLTAIHLLSDGPLAPIAPVGDSIIVIFLCLTVIGQYFSGLRAGLGELAGVTAPPGRIASARRALRPALAEDGGTLRDLSVTKIGRGYLVTVYYDPGRPVTAGEIDQLTLRLIRDLQPVAPGSDVLLIITGYARRWPAEIDPLRSTP